MVARDLKRVGVTVFSGLRAGDALNVVPLASVVVAEISNVAANRAFCAGNRRFNGTAWESAAAQSAGNVGTRPATHTTDAAPRPASLSRFPSMSRHDLHGSERRLQSAGSKCAPSPRASFARGEGGGRGEVSLLLEKTK
jgi:hypothetical protein